MLGALEVLDSGELRRREAGLRPCDWWCAISYFEPAACPTVRIASSRSFGLELGAVPKCVGVGQESVELGRRIHHRPEDVRQWASSVPPPHDPRALGRPGWRPRGRGTGLVPLGFSLIWRGSGTAQRAAGVRVSSGSADSRVRAAVHRRTPRPRSTTSPVRAGPTGRWCSRTPRPSAPARSRHRWSGSGC